MAGEWKTITLGEFIRLQRGHDLTEVDRRPGTVPVVGSAGINGYHDTALSTGPGLTIGRSGVGSMGVVTYVPTDYWPHNTVLYATDFLGNDPRFAYYFLQHLNLRRFNSGSAQASLNRNYIYPISIRVPAPVEQQAIAGILGSLDDKIELNRRRSRTLEALARAIFQSWFVDFDPVRAKAAGRTSPGLKPDVANLFPDGFENSELGEVPKAWNVEPFGQHIMADRGLSYKGEGLRDDGTGLAMHNLNSIFEGGGYKHAGIKYYDGEYRDKHLLKPGDMIVTNTEQGFDHLLIGYAAIVPDCFGSRGLYSHHIYRIRCKTTSPFDAHYLVELFNSRRWHDWISGFSNGTTINMLPLDAMEKPLLVVPPEELVDRYSALAKATHERVEDNRRESETVAALRDALLPKLISGELRVPDAERIVGRVI